MRFDNGIQDHLDFRGLLGHDEYSDEFRRLLCVAKNDGVSFYECLTAAQLIRSNNGPGWRQAWEELARTHLRRAEDFVRAGNGAAAQKAWLHAANYFMAAAIGSNPESADPALGALAGNCLRHYLENLRPQGETVAIPWLEGRSLEGFFLPVGSLGADAAPVVVCIAETRRTKEEILSLVLRSARQRGMSLLCVDLPDDAAAARSGPATAITAILDYLIDCRGIDRTRIAVIGDGSPSSLVTRGIALDGRVAAAVCDGGLWDLWASRQTDASGAALGMMPGCTRPPAVTCPLLVPLRAGDGIEPGHARHLLDQHYPGNREILLKVFGETSNAPWTADGYDLVLVADFVFDWLSQRLKLDDIEAAGSDGVERRL
ncbi:hypothetical protein DNX69_17680 [Rhodopseudomonas palustris]|uniref:Alpha/beta hydrolase n=1 Tax=Rhodopseudomonas palustris TaxID=1076 RepID=A0A323UE30_RHOPL|nr:alpha/beta hydrolase [Rhodopseudomonas palustris]PZA11142.1 hypothetical protein DNX69_17680 [Rhodopseudomonas palustris]